VQYNARSRDLVLLKAIEKTLAQLDEDMVQLQMANAAAERFISILRDKDIEVRLDNSVDLVAFSSRRVIISGSITK
jgi:hypothetical protein